jgi:TonB family protein
MEQLKRWREERAARRWRRIRAAGHPAERAAAPIVAPQEEPRKRRRRRFRLWPDPPRVSPVHPAWDDATGGLLKRSFYRAIAVHLVLVPTLLLLSRIDLNLHLPRPSGNARYRVIALYAGRSAGGGHSAARPGPLRPATAPKPPPQNRAERPKPPPKPKASAQPAGGAVDPRRARPVPVPEAPPRATTAPGPQPPVEDAGEASTDPEAREGPLLAGTGPVAGSEASIGDLDGVYFPYNYYLEVIRGKVAQAWLVPEGLVSRGRRLESVVRFRILRDGTVSENVIEEPSGVGVYDQTALRAVSEARRFPPLPQEFGGEFLVVHFQFAYVGR